MRIFHRQCLNPYEKRIFYFFYEYKFLKGGLIMKPPVARQIPHQHVLHGDVREDPYYWMKDRNNPEVIQYLEEENRYYREIMKSLENLTNEIYQAMIDRIPEKEENVPVKRGPFFYYVKKEREKQYPIFARKRASSRETLSDAAEEVILDLNQLAQKGTYLSVTEIKVSNDHRLLAYLENRDGTDRYTLFIKDLETGELFPEQIPNVFISDSVEWSNCGNYIFYITVDEQQRPYRLWRHRIGTEARHDELIYEEEDPTYNLILSKSQSGKFLFIQSKSSTTSEVRLIDADSPLSSPVIFDVRREGIEYELEHWGNHLLILTNEGALNFRLLRCPLDDFQKREPVIPYKESRYLEGIYPFRKTLFLVGRENGLTQIWEFNEGDLKLLEWDEPIYTVEILPNQSYEADEVLIVYQSCLTPKTTFSLDLSTDEKKRLQVMPIKGKYDPADYHQEQIWATAEDGVKIPINLVYRKDVPDHGPAPLILHGYGAYGICYDPLFSPYLLPLLDKGVILATAQIRGGSEMGRKWYEDGKMQKKRNTFTDFIAAAKHLIREGYTTPEKLAAKGGSAGGLLVGAVANMAGDLFKVIDAEVPFVDVLTTMLDESIPLTAQEWKEWGNPKRPEDYFYMKSYSPYDNVEAKNYPHLYVTAGLNDPRVGYWEPAKWVAKLRKMKTDQNTLVLKVYMGAGHFGSSGRLNQLKEVAESYAFVLDKIGMSERNVNG